MAELAKKVPRMTFDDWLEFEEHSAVRHEFVDGELYAMNGGTDWQNYVAGNFYLALRSHLRGSECQVFLSDMKLRAEVRDNGYYPDVLVSCDASDRARQFRKSPILLIEVASPSTQRNDKSQKKRDYETIPSLAEYVIAQSETAKVEIFRRKNAWQTEEFYLGDKFTLECIDLEFDMADVYEDVDFVAPPQGQGT